MRVKLVLSALAASLLVVCLCTGVRLSAQTNSTQASQSDFAKIRLDGDGCRGTVLFNHRLHEGQRRPSIADALRYGLNAPANSTCITCHHPIKQNPSIEMSNDARQYQRCSNCHFREANFANPCDTPDGQKQTVVVSSQTGKNPVDLETGRIELNSREAYHRMCISCHQVAQAKTVKSVPIKCAECHDLAGVRGPGELIADLPTGLSPEPANNTLRPILSAPISTGDILKRGGEPAGYAGASHVDSPPADDKDREPVTDRWRQTAANDPRYTEGKDERFIGVADDPRFRRGRIYNPYNQNVFKGDYPIWGQHLFLVTTFESETLVAGRRIPVPSGASSSRPDTNEFFGRGEQFALSQSFVTTFELFHGDTSFKPIDWRIRFTPVFNINYVDTQENNLVNINPVLGTNRYDTHVGFQELFGEVRIGDTTKYLPFLRGKGNVNGESPYYDTTFVRVGIQQLKSDFRGFVFDDFNLGARLFGQAESNRYQFNAAYFYMLEKDTNSGLNRRINLRNFRNQSVLIANLYRQDTLTKGYTSQFSFHYNDDRPSVHFDVNNFLVRPALIGSFTPHGIKSYYFGWAGDGHINCSPIPLLGKLLGRCNVDHQFYEVVGHDSLNPIAGVPTSINAQMAAVEISKDRDWLRFKGSFFWASGDKKPFDGVARGFDSILDNTEFAGGINSFFQSNPIPFGNTAILLTTPGSLLPNLRSSKIEGQSNFVNPGIFIYNTGLEAELTPKLRGILNLNYSHFHHTETLEELLFQPNIPRSIGVDYGVGFIYRPKLSENIIIEGGFNSLIPGSGFRDIYSSVCSGAGCGAKSHQLFSVHLKVKFTF